MTPIPPPALFLLIESGYSADLMLQLGAQAINGISNKKGGARGRAADPEFGQLLAALQRVQASGAVGLHTEVSKQTKQEGTLLTMGRKEASPDDTSRVPSRPRMSRSTSPNKLFIQHWLHESAGMRPVLDQLGGTVGGRSWVFGRRRQRHRIRGRRRCARYWVHAA